MITIQHGDVDIGALIEQAKQPEIGGIVVFDGIVRDDDILAMELEAYEEVAVPELQRIADEATAEYGLLSVDIVHRIGRLDIGENILVIVAAAGHRKEAFAGCEYILERIKESVPIWKKEHYADGEARWVACHCAQPEAVGGGELR